MERSCSRSPRRAGILPVLGLSLLLAAPAAAETLVTFEFEAVLGFFAGGASPPPGIGVGTIATGTYTFDADQAGDVGPASASYAGGLRCVQLNLEYLHLSGTPNAMPLFDQIVVADDAAFPGSADQYVLNEIQMQGDLNAFSITLLADQETDGIQGLGLPAVPPPLASFDSSQLLEAQIQNATVQASLNADVTRLALAAEQPDPETPFVCPEPASLLLAAIAVATLAGLAERRAAT